MKKSIHLKWAKRSIFILNMACSSSHLAFKLETNFIELITKTDIVRVCAALLQQ